MTTETTRADSSSIWQQASMALSNVLPMITNRSVAGKFSRPSTQTLRPDRNAKFFRLSSSVGKNAVDLLVPCIHRIGDTGKAD